MSEFKERISDKEIKESRLLSSLRILADISPKKKEASHLPPANSESFSERLSINR